MRLIRFMGREEFDKLVDGEHLVNHTDWKARGSASTSKGFCFFDRRDPKELQARYIQGAAYTIYDYAVAFTAGPNVDLQTCFARYRDPEKDPAENAHTLAELLLSLLEPGPTKMVKEYSLEEYDRKTLQIEEAWRIERDLEAGVWEFRPVKF